MTRIRTHRDLIAWQLGMRLAQMIYQVTRQMPQSEQFGLVNQMRRAAVSVPSNIAEGYARQSTADYLKHLRIARGSLAELSTQFELSVELKMLIQTQIVADLLAEADRVLQGLIRSLEKK
ncbi:MAG: four helix bundle protein [Tepidisphaeraceae bacterium]